MSEARVPGIPRNTDLVELRGDERGAAQVNEDDVLLFRLWLTGVLFITLGSELFGEEAEPAARSARRAQTGASWW